MIKKIDIEKNGKEEREISIAKKERTDFKEISWEEKEGNEVEKRIINLRLDQLTALTFLVGVNFSKADIEKVVSEIKENGHNSVNLGAILHEADSKENLLWWLELFEKYNKK